MGEVKERMHSVSQVLVTGTYVKAFGWIIQLFNKMSFFILGENIFGGE